MLYLLIWWFLLLLLGFAALPITMRLLRFLPDRGYAFAKPLALLVWVYPFWLLAIFGFIQNSFGALAFLLVVVALLSWGVLRGKGADSVIAWLRSHWRYVLVVEVVFAIALAAFAYFRAFTPEISATEKPMEFMFLNSILQSSTFPPRDAWFAGYGISYYYLGYVIVAALAKLGSVPSGYAFNLGLIMTFALAAIGAFGLIFNLVSHTQKAHEPKRTRFSLSPYFFGILAVFMLLVIGNLEGVFEAGYNGGVGSREFYAGLDLHGLEDVQPVSQQRNNSDEPTAWWSRFVPQDNWWWWRASRVINDVTPGGGHSEIIDEFPAFSFLLGDLHPHVLALPYGLLALAVALNLLLQPQSPISNLQSLSKEFFKPRMLLIALIVGALGMLNTWDIVTYGVVIAAAFAIGQYRAHGKASTWMLISSAAFLVAMFIVGFVLFLPFYIGFSSQAHGVVPNLTNRTPIHQYLIMWGMFVFVIASLVVLLVLQVKNKGRVLTEWGEFALPLLFVPIVIAALGAVVVIVSPSLRDLLAGTLGVGSEDALSTAIRAFAESFIASPWTFLFLVILLSGIIALGRLELGGGEASSEAGTFRTGVVFALLLALVGLVLTFGVEFLYILDSFGSRMNTVFKLYYQGWLLLAIAATFGTYYIWQATRGIGRAVWAVAFAILFAGSMIYPVLAFPNRANGFDTAQVKPTLDGWAWVQRAYPDDYAAMQWLTENAPRNAVVLESSGNQYSFDDRVSVATGLPTIIGWIYHEAQWGRADKTLKERTDDVAEIYQSRSLDATRDLLAKYNVDYVVVGGIERDKYKLNSSLVDKFGKLGEMVFEQGSMRIYQVGQPGVSFNTP